MAMVSRTGGLADAGFRVTRLTPLILRVEASIQIRHGKPPLPKCLGESRLLYDPKAEVNEEKLPETRTDRG
jgi:hypothetical protein